ncbi:MAG: hypothetical protein Q4G33_03060 [bacterium]|nr:hypothetical protein [bacterium]
MIEKAEQVQRSAFSMPQQIIDEVLTTGGNDRDSVMRICVQYSKNKSAEENIAFLKNEYGTGGKGFIFDGNKVSVWWNEAGRMGEQWSETERPANGIQIAYGERASGRGELVSWEQAEKRIGELLELGRFAPQETLDGMNEFERRTAAVNFYEMYRDSNRDEYPELEEYFNKEWFKGAYDDTISRTAELFSQTENVIAATAVADALNRLYVDDENIMRFRLYSPDKVLSVLEDLRLEHKTFTSDRTTQTAPSFITEDEIDRLLTRGSGYNSGKVRIYLYFNEHTDRKERIDFLKNEYGTGGYGGGVFNEWHDAKGIIFSRSDIMSPLAKVTIPWNKAEKRIDSLIKSNRYLTEREIAEDIPRYRSEQEQQKIRNEKYDYLHNMITDEWDSVSKDERMQTLPKRLAYFTDLLENYEKQYFDRHQVEDLIDKTEIGISEAIKNPQTRQSLIDTMNDLKGYSTGLTAGCAYKFAEELAEIRNITLEKVGDFYEIYGEEAVEAARVLEITLTRRHNENGDIPMTGFPVHVLERYTRILNESGYVVDIPQKEYDLGFGSLGNGTTVWNRLEEENGDYKTVAHIDETGEIKYYEDLPDDVKQRIEAQAEYDNIIGRNLVIDERSFVVESVDYTSGDVSMRDVTFENNVGFPINRVEKIDVVERILTEQEQTAEVKQEEKSEHTEETEQVQTEQSDLTPNFKRPKSARVDNTVIYPEIPMSERHNFRITDDNLGVGGPKEKFKNNIAAIEMLKTLEEEHRLAMPEEQEILSRYVGWGGLSDAFDETKDNWHTEYSQLKNLLTDTEYSSARESSLTAFYTPPLVIRSIYNALENMGLKSGNILDPSMGVGNFEGMMPDSLSGCKVYGIELDSISGRIAQQLYQKNSVAIQGYQNSTLPDSFFDCSFGNPADIYGLTAEKARYYAVPGYFKQMFF